MLQFFSADSLSIIDGSNPFPATSLSIIDSSNSFLVPSLSIIDGSLSSIDTPNSFPVTSNSFLLTRYQLSTTQIPFRRPRSSIATVQPSIAAICKHPRTAHLASAITIPLHTHLEMCRSHFKYTRRSHDTHDWQKQTLRPNDARRAPRGATRAFAH